MAVRYPSPPGSLSATRSEFNSGFLTPSRPDEECLVVHNFTQHEGVSSQELLHKGRSLMHAASQEEGWFQPPSNNLDIFRSCGSTFSYSLRPPLHFAADKVVTMKLPEWNDDMRVHEIGMFDMDDLDEFQCTDLTCVFHRDTAVPLSVRPEHRLTREEHIDVAPPEEPPRKRQRRDHSSLSKIIPQPHFHASPRDTAISSSRTARDAFSSKLIPTPVPPQTDEAVQQYFSDPYARGAWIIPVRGALPWDNSTPASMLAPSAQSSDSTTLVPFGPSSEASHSTFDSSDEITWTHRSLSAFWDFLLHLRDVGTLGPLSMSFHAAPVTDPSGSSGDSALLHSQTGHSGHSDSRQPSGSYLQPQPLRSTLLAVDHIKVYHDIRFTRYLRNVLRAWRYVYIRAEDESVREVPQASRREKSGHEEVPAARIGEGESLQKVRIFKGARLVLVDERSRAVLTC